MRRGSSHEPAPVSGTRPRCTKFQAMRARLVMMRTSAWVTNSAPIPTAGPSTAAITGFGHAISGHAARGRLAPPPAAGAALVGRRVGEVRQVGAGAERAAAAGHDDHPGPLVLAGVGHGGDEVAQHRVRHGVALLRAVDRDDPDALVVDLVADVAGGAGQRIGHQFVPFVVDVDVSFVSPVASRTPVMTAARSSAVRSGSPMARRLATPP